MVSGGDAALKKDVEDKLDESLAADLASCFADDPAHARSGQLVVSLQVAPDGHVASMPSSFSATAGSSVHCMKQKLTATKFVARSRASTVTIVLIWSSP